MLRPNILGIFCLIAAFLYPGESRAQTSGILSAPTAAAYADLTSASKRILEDVKKTLPKATIIVLYDASVFSAVPYYTSALDLVRGAADDICNAENGFAGPRLTPSIDVGTAAQGLAALIQVTIPTYAVQNQNLSIDNSALVGSFAAAAKANGYTVMNPAYLLPAVSQKSLTCADFRKSDSLADLWKFINSESSADQVKSASKKSLKGALDAFQKLKDALLSSQDKAPPLLGRALAVESLARDVQRPASTAVIDMRLDVANVDSTSKNVLWWRKTHFSANVAAHYWIFAAKGSGPQFGIVLVEPGFVNILTKNVDLKTYGANGIP